MEHRQTDLARRDRVVAALMELIEALDRRVPRVERAGEIAIARDAAALRKEALARLDELKRAGAAQHERDVKLAHDVMSDDGGPLL